MAGYGDDTKFAAWMTSNGYSLPGGDVAVAVLRQRGSSYLDGTYEAKFPGRRTGGLTQERAWPRTGAEAYGSDIPSDLVPLAIEHASYHAALYEAQNPGALAVAVTASAAVKREKIGPIETEYFEGANGALSDATPMLSAVEGLLSPFLAVAMPAIFVI